MTGPRNIDRPGIGRGRLAIPTPPNRLMTTRLPIELADHVDDIAVHSMSTRSEILLRAIVAGLTALGLGLISEVPTS